jgi:hypothetical protein
MQLIFMMAIGLMIITIASMGSNKITDTTVNEAQAAAAHMAVYHTAAVNYCKETTCASGIISTNSVKSKMSTGIANGPLLTQQLFTSNYDAPSKTVVTYMKPTFALRGSVNFATVNSALRDLEGADTSSFGRWDGSAKKVAPSYVDGLKVNYSIPSGISAVLANGSPVIVNVL